MEPEGIAVVTGASRGIGRAVAIELARAGFDVVATMRSPVDVNELRNELGDKGGRIDVQALDVTRPETIRLPMGLRVLVNNAGIERDHLPLEAAPMEHWRDLFETNVFGLVEVTRRAVPLMRAGGGVICNVTSSSLVVSVPFYSVYRASKAAVQSLGESLRAEVAQFGIRVIEIMPGPVDTDMLAASARRPAAFACPGYEAMAQAMMDGRAAVTGMTAPVASAATAVVSAILAEDGPLRWSCDPLGKQLLTEWQAAPERLLGGS